MKRTGLAVLGIMLAAIFYQCGDGPDSSGINQSPDGFGVRENYLGSGLQTTIKAKPAQTTASLTAKFSFSCSAASCTFKCNLDNLGFKKCGSPKTYNGLIEGVHNFQVKATDGAGRTDKTPAKYNWIIDFAAPIDKWILVSPTGAPSARYKHAAVWTGSEMIIWGGKIASTTVIKTGARYNPVTDSWKATSTKGSPSERAWPAAVWTGSRMIIYGGYEHSGASPSFRSGLSNGGKYNPATDSWAGISKAGAFPGELYSGGKNGGHPTCIWTGAEMIIWSSGTGARYNPANNIWNPTATYVPKIGFGHLSSAVWTESKMIVWGGCDDPDPGVDSPGEPECLANTNNGAIYNPEDDSWIATSTANAPTARDSHTAVWSGTEMIVWGGKSGSGISTTYTNTGGKYNPMTDLWTEVTTTNAPAARSGQTAVWTTGLPSPVMIVWGGKDDTQVFYSGGKYNPDADSWTLTVLFGAPTAVSQHTSIWTTTAMIVWGGYSGTGAISTGGMYFP